MLTSAIELEGRSTIVTGPVERVIDVTALSTYCEPGEHAVVCYRRTDQLDACIVFGIFAEGDRNLTSAVALRYDDLEGAQSEAWDMAAGNVGVERSLLRRFVLDNQPGRSDH